MPSNFGTESELLTLKEEQAGPDGAWDTFLTFSRFSPLAAEISDKEMKYKLPDRRRGKEALAMARLVIKLFKLPLEASLDEFKIDSLVLESTIILKYTGR